MGGKAHRGGLGRVLSVIVPVRNHARPLRRLLENLAAQKAPPDWVVEIIVVDNQSTDDTLEIIRASGVSYAICNELGPGPARNMGVRLARGQLLYFIDADACPVYDDHFIRLVVSAQRLLRQGLFGAFGGAILPPRYQLWNPIAIGDHWACWFNWHPKRAPQRSTLFQPALSLVMLRSVFDAIGGFDASIRVMQDMDIQHRVLRRGLPVYFVPALSVTHEARDTLLRSWRHSWYWGGPFRSTYLADVKNYPLKYPREHKWFVLNLPMLFRRRMRLVTRAVWANSKWQAIYGFPFYALTIFVWTLGVIWGPDQPGAHQKAPI